MVPHTFFLRPHQRRPLLTDASKPRRPTDELDAWVLATSPDAVAYAASLVRDWTAAEDVVHDCYCRLLARSDVYDLPRDGRKLLFKAVTNACINACRRRVRVCSLDQVEASGAQGGRPVAASPETEPDRRAMLRELESAVAVALGRLPVMHRAVFELRSLDYSLREIAEMLDLSHANVRVMLFRARQSLAARLAPFSKEKTS